MPTTYTETTVLETDSFVESFNEDLPIDVELFDNINGSLGLQRASQVDTSDAIALNLTAGFTYTFVVVVNTAAADSAFTVGLGDQTGTAAGLDGTYEVTLTYTAETTGTAYFNLSQTGGTADYSISVEDIVDPSIPTEGDDYIVGNMTSDRVNLLGGNDTYIALGGSDQVWGGLGNDYLDGVCGNDKLWGEDGNDTILGGNGRDSMWGGIGDDSMNGQNQEDMLWGNEGNDTLIGEKGDDTIDGGTGDDDIDGGKDNDLLTGGTGADIFRYASDMGCDTITDFTSGEDRLDVSKLDIWDISQLTISQVGDNARINFGDFQYVELTGVNAADLTNADFILDTAPVIAPTNGGDNLTGTNAAETFDLMDGSDFVRAGGGNDTILGGSGIDTIYAGNDDDYIDGGSGADRLYGDQGNDIIYGQADNDLIFGGEGNDYVNGGNANDRLYGDAGNDTLIGDNGNDKIWGGTGNDLISGGAGKDLIDAGDGDDTIDGGWGDDKMTGGTGSDIFVFDDRMRADTITDFTDGEDRLDMTAWGFTTIDDMTFQQVGDDVFIQFTDRDSLLLQNVDAADLDASDFIF
ncbi:calcium-binding protein [uncultured Pseudosulfitobacter sp.]|uniref:calcium-binding protein n=1 Tax=uncultured Pseudosulfitobacter sp. TaxID=2854214 RepID=UPI0030D71AC1|tara:strand:- start:3456 stop:5186 length:1731 start_codon:yes stop_codon:yes gene_type:complete